MRTSSRPRGQPALLRHLQELAISYFTSNQLANGFILDRQHNHATPSADGMISTSATGMGLIAIALASCPEYGLISRSESRRRVQLAIKHALTELPQHEGVMPHFVDSKTGAVVGEDAYSTVDTAWLIAGALVAGEILRDESIKRSARKLYRRLNWSDWMVRDNATGALRLSMGAHLDGTQLTSTWDRLNSEVAFMYLLGIGAARDKAIPASAWFGLDYRAAYVEGIQLPSGDLGLFTAQYSQLFLSQCDLPRINLDEHGRLFALANRRYCLAHQGLYSTFGQFWGLSAGDGPGKPGEPDVYRAYAPGSDVDGTAHVTASIASICVAPDLVRANLRNLLRPEHPNLIGRYGVSNVNLDSNWQSTDVVGIDLGAMVMALDNFLHGNRVAKAFQSVPAVAKALHRLERYR